jgi:hypothetical protein
MHVLIAPLPQNLRSLGHNSHPIGYWPVPPVLPKTLLGPIQCGKHFFVCLKWKFLN